MNIENLGAMQELIKNAEQYDKALERIYELMQLELLPDTDLYNELDNLADWVKAYDREHYPLQP